MGRYSEPNDAGGDADQYNDAADSMPERDWDDVNKDEKESFQEQGCFAAAALKAHSDFLLANNLPPLSYRKSDAQKTSECNGFYSMGGL